MHKVFRASMTLFIVTAIAGLCLGLIYTLTLQPIANQNEIQSEAAMKSLLPNADSFKSDITIPEDSQIISETTGYAAGEIVGYILETAPYGYSSNIDMLVAIDTTGTVLGVNIVTMSETPGLGENARDPEFIDQYNGKSGKLDVTKSGNPSDNEIQAMTSATITSKAVTLGVNDCIDFYNTYIAGGESSESK